VKGSLGSRHRAAVGITTGSDAVAIVVSEENGIISIAEDGKLQQHITEEELRKKLTNIIVDSKSVAAKLRKKSKERKNSDSADLGI
jgi:diadenylate cyclase